VTANNPIDKEVIRAKYAEEREKRLRPVTGTAHRECWPLYSLSAPRSMNASWYRGRRCCRKG